MNKWYKVDVMPSKCESETCSTGFYYEYVDDVGEGSDTETFVYEHRNLNDWVKPGEWLSQYVERNTFDGCL